MEMQRTTWESDMDNIKKEIQEHLQLMDSYLNFEAFTGKNLVEWIEPLMNSLTDDGAVSYLMGSKNKERYRASPLASAASQSLFNLY